MTRGVTGNRDGEVMRAEQEKDVPSSPQKKENEGRVMTAHMVVGGDVD